MNEKKVNRTITQIVEEQVQRWRAENDSRPETRPSKPPPPFEPAYVITVSRAAGTYGGEVGRTVGQLLGMPVYDQEIVEHIASVERVRRATVDTLDERVQNRLDDYMSALFREKNFDQSDYMTALTRTIMGLWGHGPCVLVGRGANNIIYRKYGLSVRITAPKRYRVRLMQYAEKIDAEEASALIDRVDAERESFVKRHFGANIDDPNEYDMVLNVTGIRCDDCAAIIADAYRRKFQL